MIAVAIFSLDPVLRLGLEQMLRADLAVAIVGVADAPSALLLLLDRSHVDAVVADAPPPDQLSHWRVRHDRTRFVILVDGADPEDAIEAFHAGAAAILPRAVGRNQIVAAIEAVTNGLAVAPRGMLAALLDGADGDTLAEELPEGSGAGGAKLTPRELEVLAAMADGASNKAIARRLEISFHTAKFHVAAIMAKLDADSRTEAVTKAAQLGLVML
jgi:DNA-binding NarL/FixJ family response regulator